MPACFASFFRGRNLPARRQTPEADQAPLHRPARSIAGRGRLLHRVLPWGFALLLPSLSGCAIHYYDSRTGTEHLWGFGHLKMKSPPPNEGTKAVVTGVEMIGAGVQAGNEDYGISLGWTSHRKIAVGDDASVRLEWPDADFFNVRVGTKPPPSMQSIDPNPK
jgi:hypothetical protein